MPAPKAAKVVTTDDIQTDDGEKVADGYTRLVSPQGSETTVPDSILEALLESGYKRV